MKEEIINTNQRIYYLIENEKLNKLIYIFIEPQ